MNDQTLDPAIHIHELGSNARAAAKGLLTASTEAKNTALTAAAKALRDNQDELLEANAKDVASVEGKKPDSFIDRLKLTPDRIEGMASARAPMPLVRRRSRRRHRRQQFVRYRRC